ncbi:MAG: hypothetical protein WD226_10885 [Planctomycetota bacterium]
MTEVDPESLTIREYQPGDEHAILATFNRVFREVDPDFVDRTLEEWRWTYLDNPSGWRISLALTPAGEVVSQYAGIAQRMRLDGEPAYFSQAVDSMTDPAWRKGLKRPGFFVLTGYPYAAQYGGPPPDKDVVMWGAPVPAAWRIGKSYLEYELVRSQLKLTVEPDALRDRSVEGIDAAPVDAFGDDVEALFERAAEGRRAIAVRDLAQLHWRFRDHPKHDYTLVEARRGGELLGLAVYRLGTFDGRWNEALIADWLVPATERAAAHALRAWVRERALADGAERVTAIFPDTAPEWLAFQLAGFRAEPSRFFLVGRQYTRKYDMRWLYRNWYYTLGDTDLV